MPTQISVKPKQPAITRNQAKAQLRITKDEITEDAFIDDLIPQATRIIEQMARRQFVTATYIKTLEGFEDDIDVKHPSDLHHRHHDHDQHHDTIILPHPPLKSVESITYIDNDGNEQNVDLNDVQVDTVSEPGKIAPAFGKSWPSARRQFNSVVITFKAGYGDDESFIPDEVKRAIKLLISHYFENRDLTLTASGNAEQIEFPPGLSTVIDQFALPAFE